MYGTYQWTNFLNLASFGHFVKQLSGMKEVFCFCLFTIIFFISGASFEAQNGRRILKQPKLPVVITFNDDQAHNNKIVHAKIYISPTCTLQW